jgi:hypothetical protein
VNYYKATRPEGTDFRTGTVDYAAGLTSGEVLEHPSKPVRNNPSTYFSVSIAAADCTGTRWPCRLFRVEPVGRVLKADNLPSKRCCCALRVVEELPAHEALGPNGEVLAALVERVSRLTVDEVRDLRAAWGSSWGAARGGAWGAARGAAWGAAWGGARGGAWGAAWGAARGGARGAARGAAWDAALALLTRDLISEDHFNTLYGPWAKVIEGAA